MSHILRGIRYPHVQLHILHFYQRHKFLNNPY